MARQQKMVMILAGALFGLLWKLKALEKLPQTLQRWAINLLNNVRQRSNTDLDYVHFELPPTMSFRPTEMNIIQRRIWGEPPMSLIELRQAFRRIALDERVTGVILHLPMLAMPLADLQFLRAEISELRATGKRVICFGTMLDTTTYYVASAANQIVLQTGGNLLTIGLQNSVTFMRDALDGLGVQVDAVAISPYKSAADTFTQQEMTPEVREQINWLMDSQYEQLITGIAEGRGISPAQVRQLVDAAPYTDVQALDQGYIDAISTAEGLANYLDSPHIIPWEVAQKTIVLRPIPPHKYLVAVLPLEGLITEGESTKPPRQNPLPIFGDGRIGSTTVVHQIRQLMKNEQVGAVVLYIDSGGGSATASEAICSALDELAQVRPLVACMGAVAASGGYYIATPAAWVVAHPATITGSIGVIMAKVVNDGLLKKLRLNQVPILRGKNAGIISTMAPFTDDQRAKMETAIRRTYGQFVGRVAASRNLSKEAVDAVGGGRVWTGAQALEHGLVDELGGLLEAVQKARELANLPPDTPFFFLNQDVKNPLGPQLAEAVNPAASLWYAHQNSQHILNAQAQLLLPFRWG